MNRVILHGRLGMDPELRFAQSGLAILTLNVATKERVKRGDEWQDETTWHRVVVFGKRAEGLSKHLSKGSSIVLEGRIRNSSYTDKDNIKRYKSEIIADDVEFAGAKREGTERDAPSGGGGGGGSQRSRDGIGGSGRQVDHGPPDDFNPDDDIPF